MGTTQLPHLGLRLFGIAVACAMTLGAVACGQQKAKPVEDGPRVTSVYLSSSGNQTYNNGFQNNGLNNGFNQVRLYVTIQDGPHTVSFDIQPSTTSSYSQPQNIADREYTLQAMCIDSYCDRIAFLLQTQVFAYTNGTNLAPRTGYGNGNNSYVTSQSAKAFLFRETLNGKLEQVASKPGNYTSIQQALPDLGAYL